MHNFDTESVHGNAMKQVDSVRNFKQIVAIERKYTTLLANVFVLFVFVHMGMSVSHCVCVCKESIVKIILSAK